MKRFGKSIAALFVATVMFAAIPLSACNPVQPQPDTNTDEYTVTLDYNDETSRPRKVYVTKGESMQNPAEPLRTGYELSQWTKSKTGGDSVTFPYTPDSDVTLYAQWEAAKYDVTFDFNFVGAPDALVREVAYNDTVEAPSAEEIPENKGFNFRRWETKAEGGDVVAFPYTVKRDITFYAAWVGEDIKQFTVTFDANCEGAVENPDAVEVYDGESIRTAPRLSREGYDFLGWSAQRDAEEAEIKFPYTPTDSITLYAVWEKATYLVRFRYNYTGAPDNGIMSQNRYEYGYQLEEPEAPTRVQGDFTFEFDGWYNAAVGGTKAEFPINVTGALNLYAHWLSPLTTTNTFDAEFTTFDPNYEFLGYSNSTQGVGAILSDLPNAHSADYPLLDGAHATVEPHYVTYLFKPGATLTFTIYSDKDVSGVTLYLALSNEFFQTVTYGPTDASVLDKDKRFDPSASVAGYQISVNGTPLNYDNITVDGGPNAGGGMYKGSVFSEYKVSATFNLKEGANTILLVTNNRAPCGGTTQATAPTVDYIRLEATGAVLSWRPEYDNLYRTA